MERWGWGLLIYYQENYSGCFLPPYCCYTQGDDMLLPEHNMLLGMWNIDEDLELC